LNAYLYFLFTIIGFLTSIIGSVCGIGGGVFVKPILDAFGVLSVSAVSFLSSCTVLAMSYYSVIMTIKKKESVIQAKTSTPLAIGAAIGGVVGKGIFEVLADSFSDKNRVGLYQTICLFIVLLGATIYIIKIEKIKTYRVNNFSMCVSAGLSLGVLASFIGIGGGPINMVILYFLFSMDTKTAAGNSLYIIVFSQSASLLYTIFTGQIPEVNKILLMLMIGAGIGGGILGRVISKKVNTSVLNKTFLVSMIALLLICAYNIKQFL
jgi:Predicted permeases